MGQLEDLQKNRIIRAQQIQKGFCCGDTEGDIFKAHNVGDVHPNHPDWVWTQLPNGKYDWRVRKGQAKPTPAPAPKPSGEPDFTPKIPSEIARLTNRSGENDFDNAYRTLGAEIFKEKFPTSADFQKWVDDNPHKGIKTQQVMELYLGRKEAGAIVSYNRKPLNKTDQIFVMKKYYEDKVAKEKKAHQEKKNVDYWAGEGAKRKEEIGKEQGALIAERQSLLYGVKKDVEDIMNVKGAYEIDARIDGYNNKINISVGKYQNCVTFYVNRKDLLDDNSDFNAELIYSSIRCDCDDKQDLQDVTTLLQCSAAIAANSEKIKKTIIPYGKKWLETGKRLRELDKELEANH